MSAGTVDIFAHLPALQVMVPLIGSVVVAIVRQRHVAAVLSIACALLTPAIAIAILAEVQAHGTISYAMGGWAPPVGIEYRIDIVNAYLLVLVSVMGGVVAIYAPRSVAAEVAPEKQAWTYAMYLMCLAGLLGMAITGDAFNVFVFMEISSLAMYTLIAMGSDRRALVAAFQYLITGTLGATFYVIGIGLVFTMTGTLNLWDMAGLVHEGETSRPVLAGLAFIVVGIGLKLAMFPMHLWLPNAYAYAPTVATAFIASTATKVAVYLLLRFVFGIFGIEFSFGQAPLGPILMTTGILAMLICSLSAIYQTNIKRMLAYSSVAQVGYMLVGIALAAHVSQEATSPAAQAGLTGAISHLFNHAIIKACLFLGVGCVFYASGVTRIEDLAGAGLTMPLTMGAIVIAGLGLIGVPGTAGFVSKWYLVEGAVAAGAWWLVAAIVVSSIMAVFYVGRLIEVAYFRPATVKPARALPFEMLAMTWVLVAATVYFGIQTDISAGIAADAARELLAGWEGADVR